MCPYMSGVLLSCTAPDRCGYAAWAVDRALTDSRGACGIAGGGRRARACRPRLARTGAAAAAAPAFTSALSVTIRHWHG